MSANGKFRRVGVQNTSDLLLCGISPVPRPYSVVLLAFIKLQLTIARLWLHALMMSISLSVRLSLCRHNAKNAIFSKS